jgi:hypothetical protein
MSLVSLLRPSGCAGQAGVRHQVSEKDDSTRIVIILNVLSFLTLTPETRHPTPETYMVKEKIDMLNPYYINYL